MKIISSNHQVLIPKGSDREWANTKNLKIGDLISTPIGPRCIKKIKESKGEAHVSC